MNKKFVALLIPLMVLPMVSFGAAHWYDYITKQYRLHVGTVCVTLESWHVFTTTAYDANCNGEIFGDELQITNVAGPNVPCTDPPQPTVAGVQIYANPIFPCWQLGLDLYIRNLGTLGLKMDAPTLVYGGPYATDPGWGTIVNPVTPIPDYWQTTFVIYRWVDGVGWIVAEPTTFMLKPGELLWVHEFIHFLAQAYPEFQCHWFRFDVQIPFYEFVPDPISSYTWP
jgi:hypothetical protein